MKWSLCHCAHDSTRATLNHFEYRKKEGVEVKKISPRSGRSNKCIFSFNECNLHYESDSENLAPSIILYTFWWIKAKNITILIIIYCISKYLSIFGFFGFFGCHFPINSRVFFRASICFRCPHRALCSPINRTLTRVKRVGNINLVVWKDTIWKFIAARYFFGHGFLFLLIWMANFIDVFFFNIQHRSKCDTPNYS